MRFVHVVGARNGPDDALCLSSGRNQVLKALQGIIAHEEDSSAHYMASAQLVCEGRITDLVLAYQLRDVDSSMSAVAATALTTVSCSTWKQEAAGEVQVKNRQEALRAFWNLQELAEARKLSESLAARRSLKHHLVLTINKVTKKTGLTPRNSLIRRNSNTGKGGGTTGVAIRLSGNGSSSSGRLKGGGLQSTAKPPSVKGHTSCLTPCTSPRKRISGGNKAHTHSMPRPSSLAQHGESTASHAPHAAAIKGTSQHGRSSGNGSKLPLSGRGASILDNLTKVVHHGAAARGHVKQSAPLSQSQTDKCAVCVDSDALPEALQQDMEHCRHHVIICPEASVHGVQLFADALCKERSAISNPADVVFSDLSVDACTILENLAKDGEVVVWKPTAPQCAEPTRPNLVNSSSSSHVTYVPARRLPSGNGPQTAGNTSDAIKQSARQSEVQTDKCRKVDHLIKKEDRKSENEVLSQKFSSSTKQKDPCLSGVVSSSSDASQDVMDMFGFCMPLPPEKLADAISPKQSLSSEYKIGSCYEATDGVATDNAEDQALSRRSDSRSRPNDDMAGRAVLATETSAKSRQDTERKHPGSDGAAPSSCGAGSAQTTSRLSCSAQDRSLESATMELQQCKSDLEAAWKQVQMLSDMLAACHLKSKHAFSDVVVVSEDIQLLEDELAFVRAELAANIMQKARQSGQIRALQKQLQDKDDVILRLQDTIAECMDTCSDRRYDRHIGGSPTPDMTPKHSLSLMKTLVSVKSLNRGNPEAAILVMAGSNESNEAIPNGITQVFHMEFTVPEGLDAAGNAAGDLSTQLASAFVQGGMKEVLLRKGYRQGLGQRQQPMPSTNLGAGLPSHALTANRVEYSTSCAGASQSSQEDGVISGVASSGISSVDSHEPCTPDQVAKAHARSKGNTMSQIIMSDGNAAAQHAEEHAFDLISDHSPFAITMNQFTVINDACGQMTLTQPVSSLSNLFQLNNSLGSSGTGSGISSSTGSTSLVAVAVHGSSAEAADSSSCSKKSGVAAVTRLGSMHRSATQNADNSGSSSSQRVGDERIKISWTKVHPAMGSHVPAMPSGAASCAMGVLHSGNTSGILSVQLSVPDPNATFDHHGEPGRSVSHRTQEYEGLPSYGTCVHDSDLDLASDEIIIDDGSAFERRYNPMYTNEDSDGSL